jgi:hypothetical protein
LCGQAAGVDEDVAREADRVDALVALKLLRPRQVSAQEGGVLAVRSLRKVYRSAILFLYFLFNHLFWSWPQGTSFPQLPSTVTGTIDHPFRSPSLCSPQLPSAVTSTVYLIWDHAGADTEGARLRCGGSPLGWAPGSASGCWG